MTDGVSTKALEGALGLASLSRWGCSPLLRFLRQHGPEGVWGASRGTLLSWGLAMAVVRRFEEKRRTFSQEAELRALEQAGLRSYLTAPPAIRMD